MDNSKITDIFEEVRRLGESALDNLAGNNLDLVAADVTTMIKVLSFVIPLEKNDAGPLLNAYSEALALIHMMGETSSEQTFEQAGQLEQKLFQRVGQQPVVC